MKLPIIFLMALAAAAQEPNPTQPPRSLNNPDANQPTPIFRVTVISRTATAINYHHRSGSTKVDFRGTELMPAARGTAEVRSEMGSTKIETRLEHLSPASQFGPEYLTFVLWAVSPEGRPMNLGEVVLEGDHAKLLSTSHFQTFGLIVTAEPYFAVTQPSNVVVAENFVRNDTTGTLEHVDAKYELLQRGNYILNRTQYQPVRVDPKGPLQLAEAENAIEIARLTGAETYAADTLQKALQGLQNAQGFLRHGNKRKESETNAREATQMAEDARTITIRKIREEELARERTAAAERTAEAQAEAARASQQARLDAERRTQAEADRREAEAARREAEAAATRAAQQKAEADAARVAALSQQQAAQAEADRARRAVQQAETEKAQLRERLRQQLNMVLETRETARGLIVNISDVLFDFNRYTLKPGAREKLAKVSGILLAYPGLKVQLEGHTDSIGSDEYNLKLSRERAEAVRDYLVKQNVPGSSLTAAGMGESQPVASNDTASGRQQNRRVDMVVSGEPIGIETSEPATSGTFSSQSR